MPSNFSIPRIDVPVGRTTDGTLVYFDANFLRTFLQRIFTRVGGDTALTNTELNDQSLELESISLEQRSDLSAREAIRAVDELRNELDALRADQSGRDALREVDELRAELISMRSDCDALRGLVTERDAVIAGLTVSTDLRQRVEQLEGAVL